MTTDNISSQEKKLTYEDMSLDDLILKLLEGKKREMQLFFPVHHRCDPQRARGKSNQVLKNELTGGS